MPKILRELFVDRIRQSNAFCKMLDGHSRRRIMTLKAGPGLGKSWLLHVFAHEVKNRNLGLVQIDFADRQPYDSLMLVRRCRDGLGAEHFNPLTQIINDLTLVSISLTVERGQPVQSQINSVPSNRNVSTQGGDYAEGNVDKRQGTFVEVGPVIRDNSFVIQTDDPWARQAIEDRINTAFFECLARLCEYTKVVFLFDTYERNSVKSSSWMPRAADRWICGQLLQRIREGKLTNAIVVLAGRRLPEFDAEWNEVLGALSLDLLESGDFKEYLCKKRGLSAIDDAQIELLHKAIAGSPQILGIIGDNLVRASTQVQDDEW